MSLENDVPTICRVVSSVGSLGKFMSTFHQMNIDHAVLYGVDGALFIEGLRMWLRYNMAEKRNHRDGKYWSYNTMEAWSLLYPYWSYNQIRTIIAKLEKAGVLISDNFNSNPYDRTKWYTLSDDIDLQKNTNEDVKICKSTSTYTNTVNTVKQDISDNFDIFWKAYPRKSNKGFTRKVFSKLNPNKELLDKILKSISIQRKSEQWKNVVYIPHASTWLNNERWEDDLGDSSKGNNRFLGGAI